jgi:hypothetical protein
MSVKRAYSTNMGEYRQNKKKAVERAISINPLMFSEPIFVNNQKIDDLCDAFLLAHFFTFHQRQHIKFSRPGVNNHHNAVQESQVCVT